MRRVRFGNASTAAVAALLVVVLTASASGYSLYRIRSGDTLGAIAHRYHTTVSRLVALNHLRNGNLIYVGETLRVPRPEAVHPRTHWRTVTTTYVVRRGDTLSGIAARFHTPMTTIARRNHLPRSLTVVIGQRLRFSHRVRVSTGSGSTAGRAHLFTGGRVPSAAGVASIIRHTARRWGVDSRLALAVAWQESGFNQRWVSPTGAVGAMQIEPYTGAFVSTYLVHRRLDLYDAHDNATAGVALLSVLLRETHGNQRKAVAGYYQGLASVRARGMFTDTKAYVRNVLALRNRF